MNLQSNYILLVTQGCFTAFFSCLKSKQLACKTSSTFQCYTTAVSSGQEECHSTRHFTSRKLQDFLLGEKKTKDASTCSTTGSSGLCKPHLFCLCAISKAAGRNFRCEGRTGHCQIVPGALAPRPGAYPGQSTHSCWAKCQHTPRSTAAAALVSCSNLQLTCTAWKSSP